MHTKTSDLRHLNIEITGWCNQNCGYCFNNSSRQLPPLNDDMSWWQEFLGKAKRQGIESIHVTGGEPFSWAHIISFLDLCQQLGFDTSVLSNGYNVAQYCDQHPGVLSQLCVAQISLDSLDEEVTVKRRGYRGALTDALSAMYALRDLGVEVEISAVVDSQSRRQLKSLCEFARSQGFNIIPRIRERSGRHEPYVGQLCDAKQNQVPTALNVLDHNARVPDRYYYLPTNRDKGCIAGTRTISYDGRFLPRSVHVNGRSVDTIDDYFIAVS